MDVPTGNLKVDWGDTKCHWQQQRACLSSLQALKVVCHDYISDCAWETLSNHQAPTILSNLKFPSNQSKKGNNVKVGCRGLSSSRVQRPNVWLYKKQKF
ncbi:Malate dehydrogenase, cytoplasmic [Fusarium oxysporum f. sp. albedinis]|nr:Malate dehydrogenase, cytoplasmic [Fusarium oxysporum f. sp. albedinis]